jgi:YVTN family beta-propeller protein
MKPDTALFPEFPWAGGRVQRRRRERRARWAAAAAISAVVALLASFVAFGSASPLRELGGGRARDGAVRMGDAGPAAAIDSHGTTPLLPRRLSLEIEPDGAKASLATADGRKRTVRTPYAGVLPGGAVEISVTMDGYNPLTERIVLDRERSVELWLDPEGLLHHKLGEFGTGSAPKQVAFTPDGDEIWVTPLGEGGIEVYDAFTLSRKGEIATGRFGTVEIIFTRDGATAFASQMQTASVFEIDTGTRTVRRQLFTNSAWSKVMALSPDERTLYVANWSGDNVTEIDLPTGTVRRQIPTVDTPRGLYVTPDGERLFVAGFGGGEVQRIRLSDGASNVILRTGGAMRHLVGDPERAMLYADDMSTDETFAIDLATERARKLSDTDNTPNTMDLTPDGRVLYVSNRGANGSSYYLPGPEWGSVLAIDTTTGRILDAIVGGNQTTGLDVSPDGRYLAFSDFLDSRVTLYAIPTYEVLAAGGGGRAEAHVEDLLKR